MSSRPIGGAPIGGALVTILALSGVVAARTETPQRILDVPFVSQSENLCGGAAAAMVLRYWGERSVFAEDFSAFLDVDGSGISTAHLVEAVRGRGGIPLPFHGDEWIARHHLDSGRPIVVLLEVGPDRYHYVVLLSWSANEVVIHDPVRGPFRRIDPEGFRERWSGSNNWSLLILPTGQSDTELHTGSGTTAAPETAPCASLVAGGVSLAGDGELDRAEGQIEAALELCPEDPAALRELAGLRLLQSRNEAAIDLAERAVTLDPSDDHAWRTLATARFLEGDLDGALLAWNHLGEPAIDLTLVSGVERTPLSLLVRQLGLDARHVLRPESLARARRRLSEFPALSFSAVRYRPLPRGLAEIEVAAIERPLFLDGPVDLVSRSLRAVVDRELSLDVNNAARRGERWAASWRFWEERPRVSASVTMPGLFLLPGIGRIHTEWDSQTYATSTEGVTRETRKNVRLELSDWVGGPRRWDITVGGEAWEGRGGFVSVGGALEQRWLADRLSARASATGFLGSSESFATGDVEARWRSSAGSGAPLRLLGRARLGTTSNGAPLALWQGAGTGQARPTLLRAHPLLVGGVVSGEVFGRHLLSGGLELERFRSTPALVRIGLGVFVDAAKSWETLSQAEVAHVDVGAGLRLSLARYGTIRFDVARGVNDGNVALSLDFELGWPDE